MCVYLDVGVWGVRQLEWLFVLLLWYYSLSVFRNVCDEMRKMSGGDLHTHMLPFPVELHWSGGWRQWGGGGDRAGADSALTQLFSPSCV